MNRREWCKKAAAAGFWLILWQLAAMLLKNSIVMVGPAEVLESLVMQIQGREFWLSVSTSVVKIMGGFLAGFLTAIIFAVLAFYMEWLQVLVEPVILLIKSVPVASFVVLFLILIGSEQLSTVIVFLMAFPVIYINMGQGLGRADKKMLEMARVFHMPIWKRILYIYRPAFMPFLAGGARIALGMSWKSGVAAEIIGVPAHSVGERLYMAKIYLDTESLFAWTLVIILLSLAFERLFLWVLKKAGGKAWKGEDS